jgi:hypothetical protein
MSGVEVVGLVLGVLPLVIEGLEKYADGVRTIKRLMGYKWELETLIDRLRTENSIFKNTCEIVLLGLAPNSSIEKLLLEPGGSAWKTPDLARKLERRLRDSYGDFFNGVMGIHRAVKAITELLGLGLDGKVMTSPSTNL